MAQRHELWQVLDRLQMDARDMQARISDLRQIVAGMNLAGPTARLRCPSCAVDAGGPRELAEHVYHAHDGPLPAHWAATDALAAPAAEELEP